MEIPVQIEDGAFQHDSYWITAARVVSHPNNLLKLVSYPSKAFAEAGLDDDGSARHFSSSMLTVVNLVAGTTALGNAMASMDGAIQGCQNGFTVSSSLSLAESSVKVFTGALGCTIGLYKIEALEDTPDGENVLFCKQLNVCAKLIFLDSIRLTRAIRKVLSYDESIERLINAHNIPEPKRQEMIDAKWWDGCCALGNLIQVIVSIVFHIINFLSFVLGYAVNSWVKLVSALIVVFTAIAEIFVADISTYRKREYLKKYYSLQRIG